MPSDGHPTSGTRLGTIAQDCTPWKLTSAPQAFYAPVSIVVDEKTFTCCPVSRKGDYVPAALSTIVPPSQKGTVVQLPSDHTLWDSALTLREVVATEVQTAHPKTALQTQHVLWITISECTITYVVPPVQVILPHSLLQSRGTLGGHYN